PELLYTKTQSNYNYEGFKSGLSINKIDVPILLGLEVFNFGRVFLGPSFQYILNTELSDSGFFDEVKEVGSKDFSLGAQFGIGVEFGKLGVDLRWERSLTNTETDYIGRLLNENLNEKVQVDTRSQQFILSIYYKFQ
ncbi:MAG: PorT family protein, partial [Flavobacteriaceae bacterium]|nr:PorT family protein [Flavobacteriaceae bacterium]